MPTSPLPNWAVSLVPPPEPMASVIVVVVVPLSSPQAARKAATAVELPPTARNLRRDTGSLSCLISAIWRVPPGRLLAPTYGERTPGGSESADGDCRRERTGAGREDAGSGGARSRLDRLGPGRVGPGDDALRRDRRRGGGLPPGRVRGIGLAGMDPGRGAAVARVAAPGRLPARRR